METRYFTKYSQFKDGLTSFCTGCKYKIGRAITARPQILKNKSVENCFLGLLVEQMQFVKLESNFNLIACFCG